MSSFASQADLIAENKQLKNESELLKRALSESRSRIDELAQVAADGTSQKVQIQLLQFELEKVKLATRQKKLSANSPVRAGGSVLSSLLNGDQGAETKSLPDHDASTSSFLQAELERKTRDNEALHLTLDEVQRALKESKAKYEARIASDKLERVKLERDLAQSKERCEVLSSQLSSIEGELNDMDHRMREMELATKSHVSLTNDLSTKLTLVEEALRRTDAHEALALVALVSLEAKLTVRKTPSRISAAKSLIDLLIGFRQWIDSNMSVAHESREEFWFKLAAVAKVGSEYVALGSAESRALSDPVSLIDDSQHSLLKLRVPEIVKALTEQARLPSETSAFDQAAACAWTSALDRGLAVFDVDFEDSEVASKSIHLKDKVIPRGVNQLSEDEEEASTSSTSATLLSEGPTPHSPAPSCEEQHRSTLKLLRQQSDAKRALDSSRMKCKEYEARLTRLQGDRREQLQTLRECRSAMTAAREELDFTKASLNSQLQTLTARVVELEEEARESARAASKLRKENELLNKLKSSKYFAS